MSSVASLESGSSSQPSASSGNPTAHDIAKDLHTISLLVRNAPGASRIGVDRDRVWK